MSVADDPDHESNRSERAEWASTGPTVTLTSTPIAVAILPPDPDEREWLRMRQQGIGGSDALSVLGVPGAYDSRLSLYYYKRGELPPKRQTTAMEIGTLLEPVVAELFTRRTGIRLTRPGTYAHMDREWQHANPDRFGEDGSVVEIKTTAWYTTDADVWEAGDVPDHAEAQLQHYLEVTGRPHGWAVALIGGNKLYWKRVERDPGFGRLITHEEERFWRRHVLAGVPPLADGTDRTKKMLSGRFGSMRKSTEVVLSGIAPDLLAEHHDAKSAAKSAKVRFTEIENQIKQQIGDAEFGIGPDGTPIVQWRTQGRTDIDRDRLKEKYPEVYDDVLVKDTIRVFVNKMPKLPESSSAAGGEA